VTILLVGESNPYSSDPDNALLPWPENAAGDRMRRIFGMTDDEYLKTFSRANLCGARWSMPAAVEAARKLLVERRPKLIIALGVKVCGAFCRATDSSVVGAFGLKNIGRESYPLLHMPHPSGRNRIWNTPGSSARARDAFAETKTRLML
jgi:uracil-DNA glycosylase